MAHAEELLRQLSEAVAALNALVTSLRDAAGRPPVTMQVERLEVESLEFHMGDIDVQELQGQLNIGITQSLKVEIPKEEKKVKVGLPKDGSLQLTVPKESQVEMKLPDHQEIKLDLPSQPQLEVDLPDEGQVRLDLSKPSQPTLEVTQSSARRSLPHSVVTRRMQQRAPTQPPPAAPETPPSRTPNPEPAPVKEVKIWPPVQSEWS